MPELPPTKAQAVIRRWIENLNKTADESAAAHDRLVDRADADNYAAAMTWRAHYAAKYGRAPRICYLTQDGSVPELPLGSIIFPAYSLRVGPDGKPSESPFWRSLTKEQRKMVCPVDFRGKSPKRRCGPCDRCMV